MLGRPDVRPSGAIAGSARQQRLGGRRRLQVGEPRHPEGGQEAEQRGDERHEQRDLQRDGAGVLVDAQDLVLDVGGCPSSSRSSSVFVITSAFSSSPSATCSCCAGVRISLDPLRA